MEEEQKGKDRAAYGSALLEELAKRLTELYGKSFSSRHLRYMRQFYRKFPKWNALRSELSWTHYRMLLKVEKENAREFYMQEAITGNWSTRQLERQINSLYFDRLLMSKDKQELKLDTDKNKTIVKYSLLNESKQIFASKYQLYLPTVKQLEHEIQHEREQIEQEKKLSGK